MVVLQAFLLFREGDPLERSLRLLSSRYLGKIMKLHCRLETLGRDIKRGLLGAIAPFSGCCKRMKLRQTSWWRALHLYIYLCSSLTDIAVLFGLSVSFATEAFCSLKRFQTFFLEAPLQILL